MRVRQRILSAIAVSTLLACAPTRYEYAPAKTTGAEVAGARASLHLIPPESPRGDVRLAMFGVASLPAAGEPGQSKVRAVRIAFVISNRSEEPWTVDPGEQRLQLATRQERNSIAATTADLGRPAAVEVPPRSTRWVDLYFPLPARLQSAAAVPEFEVIWTVNLGTRVVAERTAFERFFADAPPPERAADPVIPGQPRNGHVPVRE